MSQTNNIFFDEVAKIFSNSASFAKGMKDEVDNLIKDRLEKLIANLDLVTKEEHEVLKEMITKLNDKNAILEKRLTELETKPKAKATRSRAKTATNTKKAST